MNTQDSDGVLQDCKVIFELGEGESLTIHPDLFLKFDDGDSLISNLLRANFELKASDIHRCFTDHLYLNSIVSLRKFLRDIENADIDETLDFNSEEDALTLTFAKQESTVRISGRTPGDDVLQTTINNLYANNEANFFTQVVFYGNFPLTRVSDVVDEISKVLDAVKRLESQ